MPMNTTIVRNFDAIIIGAGQSGPALARRLAAAGQKVAIIERQFFGGTCVNTGCTPTKTLVASAYVAHMARRANEYGVKISGTMSVDIAAIKARKDAVVEVSRRAVERSLRSAERCTVYQGHARFTNETNVLVGGSVLNAEKIFINVGGRPSVPRIPGLDDVPYFTNSSLLDANYLPPHLIILGGSYIGLELAQVYRRFGSEVTVIEAAPRLISREDDDVSHAVEEFLTDEGICVQVGSDVTGVEKRGNHVAVKLRTTAGTTQVIGTHLLVATGRRPNTDDLGLDQAGVLTDERGYIQVDDQLRTTAPGIWAMGDCNGRGAFTHTSYNDFEIVAANILENAGRKASDRITAYALYTDPPLGRVGLTESEVRKSGRPALITRMSMEDVSRAYERGETKGFMKIIVDRDSKQFVGASLLGLTGDEVVHCILDLMYAKAPYTVLQQAVHIHPTVSEFIPTMLDDLTPLQ
jgi:pyruvate/2-oxoglutarate dehydrogenase complex dihydrolipoamide dehydrogenase (E3) component